MKGSADIDAVITTPVAMDPPPAPPTPTALKPPKLKSIGDAYVLCFPLGLLGMHHFYLGSPGLGLAYLFTLGCGGIGWLVDWFRMPMLVKDANRKIEREWKIKNEIEDSIFRDEDTIRYELDTKRLSDCYVLGFVTGFLGLHHFYLRRPGWGVLYLFTFGLMGCGLLMDWFRMPLLFKRYKTKLKLKAEGKDDGFPEERHLDDAYALGFPLGLLGFHHFYLKRPCWGVLYFCTLGMLGIGFLIDLIRMKSLVDDANRRIKAKAERQMLVSGSNVAVYATNQDTVSYMITPPAHQSSGGPPGAPDSYQAPYGYPYPNPMPPVPGQQGYAAPPPPSQPPYPNSMPPIHGQQGYPPPLPSQPAEAPPPYTLSADPESSMQDPDGIPVEKPDMTVPGVPPSSTNSAAPMDDKKDMTNI